MENFKLAPLRRYRASGIVPPTGDTSLHGFLLALSVVFNDLKGLLLFQQAFAGVKPSESELSPHAGEWRGLEIQIQRYTIALVHELLTLVQTFAREAEGTQITDWMKSAHPDIRRRWRNIVKVAIGAKTHGDVSFTKVLVQIRNNVAFHYYQPKALVAGFKRHFYDTPKSPVNDFAYASLGRNMEQTRFYHADAALQGAIANLSSTIGEKTFAKRMRSLGSDINEALAHILVQHLAAVEEP